jgi:hypothetical protein
MQSLWMRVWVPADSRVCVRVSRGSHTRRRDDGGKWVCARVSIIGFQRVVLNGNIRVIGAASVADDEHTRGNSAVRVQATGAYDNPCRICRDLVDARLLQ